jgi:putative FmdB family regulatory protein
MPIYRYKCQNFGHEVEEILSFSNSEKYLQTVCPVCLTKSYKKIVNSTTFKLKGKGWYKDGYKGS